jgi:hypothetical protein
MKEWFAKQITSAFLGSWKTTTLGFVLAIYILVKPSLDAGQMPTETQWVGAIFAALVGTQLKDHDKSGTGTPGDPIRGTEAKPEEHNLSSLS